MDKKITPDNPVTKKGKELSFIQKCIIIANIFQESNKHIVNAFNNIPYVKLYTANLTDEKYVYSNIKGGLFLIYEENENTTNFFLQIYDINTYSLVFNFPINPKLLNGVVIDEKFFCVQTRNYYIGFKFSSNDSMKFFRLILNCEKPKFDINEKAKQFECQNLELIKIIKCVKENLDKKLKNIDKENDKINKEKNSFIKLDELYRLINCIEFNEINNKINIFVDKTINPYSIKSYIDSYKNTKDKNSLPYKIVFNDYNQINNKKIYVGILVKNLINNFEEEKKLIVFKREHKKRHAKEEYEKNKNNNDIRSSAMILRPKYNLDDKNKIKTKIQSNMNPIEEED